MFNPNGVIINQESVQATIARILKGDLVFFGAEMVGWLLATRTYGSTILLSNPDFRRISVEDSSAARGAADPVDVATV